MGQGEESDDPRIMPAISSEAPQKDDLVFILDLGDPPLSRPCEYDSNRETHATTYYGRDGREEYGFHRRPSPVYLPVY